MTVTTLTSNRTRGPAGFEGGQNGAAGENIVIRTNGDRTTLQGNDSTEVVPGDAFEMHTPGGGGWGAPD
jgi:5-oxoprolinase (ATP-hydrolysing)